MINILFYSGIVVIALVLTIMFIMLDKLLDNKLFNYKDDQKRLKKLNWFLKYELYRLDFEEGGDDNATKTRYI